MNDLSGTNSPQGTDAASGHGSDTKRSGVTSWCGWTIPHDPHTFAYDGKTFRCSGDNFPPEEEPDGSDD